MQQFVSLVILTAILVSTILAADTRAEPADSASLIRSYLDRLEGFGFSGAVLIARDDKILVQSAYGVANRRKQIPMRPNSIFDVGSLTKQFTAAAILKLETDRKLQLTDPISNYFKTVPPDKSGITIHHLLTHTAGFAGEFGDDYEKVTRDELISRAMTSALNSTPGQRHSYSNAGYSLLAAIVEIASGQTFETFLRERLFRPAGMDSSGYTFRGPTVHRLARGYKDGDDWGIGAEKAAATNGEFWNLIGNGGVHSTVIDMNRWIVALQKDRILTREARQKLFYPHVVAVTNYRNTNTALSYGYGWYIWKQPGGQTLVWHLGGNGVFNAAVRHQVESNTLVVYASNVSEFHDPTYPVPVIERLLAGESVEMPPKVWRLTDQKFAEYAGNYQSTSGALLSVEARKPYLKIQGEGQEALSFVTSGKWQRDAALEELNKRTAAVVENSRTAKYEAMSKDYGTYATVSQITEFEPQFWKKRRNLYGEYLQTRVLGTIALRSRGFVGRTIVAVDFERGKAYREYFWTAEGTIGDVGPLTSAPWTRHFSESSQCLVAFDPARAEVISRICFENPEERKFVAVIKQGETRIELRKISRLAAQFSD
jgi:CubicO group peptidase (beta-lactamase class C family)